MNDQPKQSNDHCDHLRTTAPTFKKNFLDAIEAGMTVVWNKKVENTEMEKFRTIVNAKYNTKLETYWELHEWSVKNYANFWEEIWHYFGVISSKPYIKGQVAKKNGDSFNDIDWFSGAQFNFAENMLRFRDDHNALICADEEGGEEIITYSQLYDQVELYASALKKHGLQMGDRVACYMPNRKEAVLAMLATTSMGGLWGGPLPYYGAKAALNIIKQMSPKFLFTSDRFLDCKVEKNILKNLPFIVSGVSSLEKVIIVVTKEDTLLADLSDITNSCFLDDFLESGRNPDGSVAEMNFKQLPFNYPICINFTSGTTGNPKGLVHSAGAFLPLLRDFGLHINGTRDEIVLTNSPVGWSLWDTHLAYLALGATLLLYNGGLFFESRTRFWDLLAKYKVSSTFIVTSCLDQMEKEGFAPDSDCNLDHLKMLTIGASPVKLQNFDYIFNKIKKDIFVGSYYGATEVFGVFSGFDLNTPVYSGQIQAPALGLDIRCFDKEGKSVVGERGELVIATPTPSLPIAVWNDTNQQKLQCTYLSKFPGVWHQSDEIWMDPKTNGFVVIGRSDDTMNCNGERFNSSEIYFAIHSIKDIADSLCVGQNSNNGDQRAVLFVKLMRNRTLSKDLLKKIRCQVEQEFTVYHVPEIILQIPDIPYNLNGKKMERLVKMILATNKVPELVNVRNPDCLNSFCNIPELQNY